MIMRRRIQTQAVGGCIDRVVSVAVRPSGDHETNWLRGCWFKAGSQREAEQFLKTLEETAKVAAQNGKAKAFLRELDYHKHEACDSVLTTIVHRSFNKP